MARINLSQAVLLWADLRFSMSACFGASVSRSAAAALFSCAIVCASSALHGCARRSSHVVRGLILLCWHLSRKSAHAFRFPDHYLFCCCALVSQQLCPSAFLPQAHLRSVKCHHTARPNSRLLQDRLSILPCANLVIRQNPSGLPPP
jgi:hypothetical protein